jgi:hypothetical protein
MTTKMLGELYMLSNFSPNYGEKTIDFPLVINIHHYIRSHGVHLAKFDNLSIKHWLGLSLHTAIAANLTTIPLLRRFQERIYFIIPQSNYHLNYILHNC